MPDKPVSPRITCGAQGAALGLSVLPSDLRFSGVSLRCLLPRTPLTFLSHSRHHRLLCRPIHGIA